MPGTDGIEGRDATGAIDEERTLVQRRVFDAPRALVWKAFTEKAHLDQWWGPNGFRNETSALEVRVGGVWRYVMNGPDGKVWPNWIRYREVTEPERLVYDHGADESDPEPHFRVTITFEDLGARTALTMTTVFPTAEACAAVKQFGAMEGGAQTLARLAGHLPYLADLSADHAMVLTRVFDAPVSRVYAAWTEAEALVHWWGPKVFTTPIVEVDFRVGGAYRMVMRDPAGNEYPFHGTYVAIVPNERIVFDAILDPGPEETIRTTVTFVDEDGKTRLTVRQDRPSQPFASAGQMEGWSGQLEKLARFLGVR